MNLIRRRFLRLLLDVAALPGHLGSRTRAVLSVTIHHDDQPVSAGGPLDTLARPLAERMSSVLGQPVIVENVTGASGSIGTARVARSAPDGYTLGLGYWGTHVANGVIYILQYDVLNDFEPIAQLASGPLLLIARKDIPVSDLTGLPAGQPSQPRASAPPCMSSVFSSESKPAPNSSSCPIVASRRRYRI